MITLANNFTDEEIDDLIAPICHLADMETSKEGGPQEGDKLLDDLILAARKIRDREGFLVVDGDDADFELLTSQLRQGER